MLREHNELIDGSKKLNVLTELSYGNDDVIGCTKCLSALITTYYIIIIIIEFVSTMSPF